MEAPIRSILKEYFKHHPIADQLFTELYNLGNLYLIGGILREFLGTGDISEQISYEVLSTNSDIE